MKPAAADRNKCLVHRRRCLIESYEADATSAPGLVALFRAPAQHGAVFAQAAGVEPSAAYGCESLALGGVACPKSTLPLTGVWTPAAAPQQTGSPFARNAQVWYQPLLMAMNLSPGGRGGIGCGVDVASGPLSQAARTAAARAMTTTKLGVLFIPSVSPTARILGALLLTAMSFVDRLELTVVMDTYEEALDSQLQCCVRFPVEISSPCTTDYSILLLIHLIHLIHLWLG